jgi:lambda repressor-like predicted transcriptional regulator
MITNVNYFYAQGGDCCMPAQWTADLIGELHLNGITHKQLAEEAGWHPKYLSSVLNGHREPKNAEKILRSALSCIVNAKQQEQDAT